MPADRRRPESGPFDGEDRDALRRALDEFASIDPRACTVVVLRSFWEFSLAEIAVSLGISGRRAFAWVGASTVGWSVVVALLVAWGIDVAGPGAAA